MKKLTITKREAVRQHRKMWRWLAENPNKYKWDYFKEKKVERPGAALCFLCKYNRSVGVITCEACPLKWERGSCNRRGDLFHEWKQSRLGMNGVKVTP